MGAMGFLQKGEITDLTLISPHFAGVCSVLELLMTTASVLKKNVLTTEQGDTDFP